MTFPDTKSQRDRQPRLTVKFMDTKGTQPLRKSISTKTGFMCPVCGSTSLDKPPRSANVGGSYEICPCCYFEFGYDDEAVGFSDDQWRRLRIAEGMPWSSRSRRQPSDWGPVEQLSRAGLWPIASASTGDAEDADWTRKRAKFRKLFDRIELYRRGVRTFS